MIKIQFNQYDSVAALAFSKALAEMAESYKTGANTPVRIGMASVTETSPWNDSPVKEAPRDTKGVAFDADFCGQAKEPFYSTGKRLGQWKKRKGISDQTYDDWYDSQIIVEGSNPSEEPPELPQTETPINTTAAFTAEEETTAEEIPQDIGAFMVWVSERQAAGVLSQEDINAAYTTAGLQHADLFTGEESVVQRNVARLYGILSAKKGE